jgi:hypothetical protein
LSKGNKAFIEIVCGIVAIQFLLMLIALSIPMAFAQTAGTSTTVPVNGLRQVPQDYYTVVLPPAGVQAQQSSAQGFGMDNVMTALTSFLGATGLSKYLDIKDKKEVKKEIVETKAEVKQDINQTKQVIRENVQTVAKIADAQLQTNQQQFANMEDKGESIKDKPAIKVDELQKTKDKALETATKA